MIQKLKRHSPVVGLRALILSPTRELALQTLKVVKEMSRGTDLRHVLLVGGDSLEEQFGSLINNPDIVIATPGRFLHVKVEMSLDLSSVQYVVLDEADRLFEMGFANELAEILHALPPSRQTLLFSATLPNSLFEFARAGLQDPDLVRLDADTKVSPDLENVFFSVIPAEKDAALLQILQDLIKMPFGWPKADSEREEKPSKKRKRAVDGISHNETPTEHSTILFAATKHRVEYLSNLLATAGFAVSFAYSSLDQTARRIQVDNFRRGRTNILVATDVAARGIDIPVLANVINYDFPPQPKVFVHRVGRTARAGRRGRSYSLVTGVDAPYLLDLQLFLNKKLILGRAEGENPSLTENMVLGSFPRERLGASIEWRNRIVEQTYDIASLETVAAKAETKYMKTRNPASSQSVKRSRELVRSTGWTAVHPLFSLETDDDEERRAQMLAQISSYRPKQTIFEFEARTKGARYQEAAEVMRKLRQSVTPKRSVQQDLPAEPTASGIPEAGTEGSDEEEEEPDGFESDDNDGLEISISNDARSKTTRTTFKNPDFYMSYTPRNTNEAEERGYGIASGTTQKSTAGFVEAARAATMDLGQDEVAKGFGLPSRPRVVRWDKRSSKYVQLANDEDGSGAGGKGSRLIRGESGVKIPASLRSGRFDRWRRDHRVGRLPRVGEAERADQQQPGQAASGPGSGRRFKHRQEKAPKAPDKYRDDYKVRKRRFEEAKEKRIGRFKDGVGGSRKELKSIDDVRKARKLKEQRKAKNARPSKKKK